MNLKNKTRFFLSLQRSCLDMFELSIRVKIYPLVMIGLLFMLSNGCIKSVDSHPTPVLTTADISDLTPNTTTCGGHIGSEGESPVTARGVCWNNAPNPTIANNITIDGSGIGSYESYLTGLIPNTKYHVRAYATNKAGTAYGNELSFFFWLHEPGPSVADIDGNVYNSIKIGYQIWMTENLKVIHYLNGDPIPKVTSDNEWCKLNFGAYCDYANNSANSKVYGKLYNWYVVNNSLKICPSGWHIPTYTEWQTLINYFGGENEAGNFLKETGSTHWTNNNTGVTNESDFTALPGGRRAIDGKFYSIGTTGVWWSSTEESSNSVWSIRMSYYNSIANIDEDNYTNGFSVRCIKD